MVNLFFFSVEKVIAGRKAIAVPCLFVFLSKKKSYFLEVNFSPRKVFIDRQATEGTSKRMRLPAH